MSDTVEKVMQIPATIIATNAGTLSSRRMGTTSHRGPRGGSSIPHSASPGRMPAKAIAKRTYFHP